MSTRKSKDARLDKGTDAVKAQTKSAPAQDPRQDLTVDRQERPRVRETPLGELVLRLYRQHDLGSSTDEVARGTYREWESELHDRTSPGQKARWERIRHDQHFKRHEIPEEEVVELVIGEKEQDFVLGYSESARWTPLEIRLVSNPGDKNERERCVIKGSVKPLARLRVDGEVYYRWKVDGEDLTAKVDDLLDRLRGEGYILCKSRAQDVLSAVASGMAERTEERHATYGMYADGDDLELCEDPLPVKDEQVHVWEQVKGTVKREATKEELQNYIDMLDHWHPYEVLPALGLGLAAPYTPVLRRSGCFVPHLFHYAPEPDLGKSLVAQMASQKMFGIEEISGEGIESHYRLAAHLDSIALPLDVEEADKLKDNLLPVVKNSAEQWIAAKRGTKELTMERYSSRAVFIMTGNTLPTETESVLKRILTVRFDSSARGERRKNADVVRDKFEELRPVGFWLERNYLADYHSKDEFLEAVGQYADQIAAARSEWESPQRPRAWAVVYFGLMIFEEGCRAMKVDWEAPSIKEFVGSVVDIVERSTWESRRTNVERFVDWFDMWRVRNTRTIIGTDGTGHEIQGENEIWKEGMIDVGGEAREGVWITSPMLDDYNKRARPAEKIPNLKELAVQAADAAAIPYDLVLEQGAERVKLIKFGSRPKRAAFLARAYTSTPPKHGYLVTEPEPVPQKNGNQAGNQVVTSVPREPSEVTKGNQEKPRLVTTREDILDDKQNTSGNQVTMNQGVAREACQPLSSGAGSSRKISSQGADP
jgi:hypothetical protein